MDRESVGTLSTVFCLRQGDAGRFTGDKNPPDLPGDDDLSGQFVEVGQMLRQANPAEVIAVDDRLPGALPE